MAQHEVINYPQLLSPIKSRVSYFHHKENTNLTFPIVMKDATKLGHGGRLDKTAQLGVWTDGTINEGYITLAPCRT